MKINVDGLAFSFPDSWNTTKYDEWSFYRNQFQNTAGGQKAVDIVALSNNNELWLIEAKDYRQNPRSKPSELPLEIAQKVCDSLAGIIAASVNANDSEEKNTSKKFISSLKQIRVALQLEQPKKSSKLFPKLLDPAIIQQKLKQLVKTVDPHPLIIDSNQNQSRVDWNCCP